MSFINPEKVPVKVYLSTDKDAPRLDRSAGCVQTILKACLVTGYGEKMSAGWTMPFEDTAKGIKVLRPEQGVETDFYLKLSNDTGREVKAEVYQKMTAIDTGDKRLECGTAFQYGVRDKISEKWAVIACGRAFWFFHTTGSNDINYKNYEQGSYLYCGDTGKNSVGDRAVYIKHTGGQVGIIYTNRPSILTDGAGYTTFGALLIPKTQKALQLYPKSQFDGTATASTNTLLSPVLIMADNEVWALPAYSPSTAKSKNYDVVNGFGREFMVHSTTIGVNYNNNLFVPTDYWEF